MHAAEQSQSRTKTEKPRQTPLVRTAFPWETASRLYPRLPESIGMHCDVSSASWSQIEADWLVVGIPKNPRISGNLAAFDRSLGGTLERLIAREDFSGKPGELLLLPDTTQIGARRVLLVGLGAPEKLTRASLTKAIQSAARRISEKRTSHVAVACPDVAIETMGRTLSLEALVTALSIGCVGQGLYQNEPRRFSFQQVTLLVPTETEISLAVEAVRRGRIVGEAVNLARELVNRPASDVFPESVADTALRVARETGLKCEILADRQLEAERMGSLLAVARGSDRPPRVVVLQHLGSPNPNAPTLALVGKGVTFDSGGLSLKPNEGMKDMKCDMAGAATVLGAMAAIARLQLPVNVVGYMGLVENMISGRSYKLGDVLTARNGVTIEVLNTDAEGRLVLADVLAYAVDRGATHIVDLATLTGACVVALGEDITGVFANNQPWCDRVLTAARDMGEEAWQLPLFEPYGDLLKSEVADCKNVGSRWGGAITAAKFLEKFVGGLPWVHMDIAGPSFSTSNGSREGGATGCMLRTLIELARHFETDKSTI